MRKKTRNGWIEVRIRVWDGGGRGKIDLTFKQEGRAECRCEGERERE